MDFRDKLLSREMRHLTELVNLLSNELVILQDFLGEEFGTKYKGFRQKHPLAQEGKFNFNDNTRNNVAESLTTTTSSRKIQQSQHFEKPTFNFINSTTPAPATTTTTTDSDIQQPQVSMASVSVEGTSCQFGTGTIGSNTSTISENNEEDAKEGSYFLRDPLQLEEDDEDDDVIELDISSDDKPDYMDENNSQLSLNSATPSTSHGSNPIGKGRLRHSIWEQYNIQNLPNGKKRAKCKKCNASVSPVCQRLQNHYNMCVLQNKISPHTGLVILPKQSKSNVWNHVTKQRLTESGAVIVTCKYCLKRISNHTTRVRRHLELCNKFHST